MRDRDDKFDSPTVVMNRIAWVREMGLAPTLQDIDWHIEDCQSGRYPEPKRRGAPSKYHEQLNTAKMVVRELQVNDNNRNDAIDVVATCVDLGDKRVGEIYDDHRDHAEELVRQEDIVGGVAKLIDSIGLDDAVSEIANLFDSPVRDVRVMYNHWHLNFPKIVTRLAASGH